MFFHASKESIIFKPWILNNKQLNEHTLKKNYKKGTLEGHPR